MVEKKKIKKRSRTQMSYVRNRTRKNLSSLTMASSVTSIDDSNVIHINPATRVNFEGITFVCLNLQFDSIANFYSLIQDINDYIQVFTDLAVCFDWIRSSNDSIFFLTSIADQTFITTIHNLSIIEAIFVLNSEAEINETDLPKLCGIFKQYDELLVALRDTLIWFERGKLEVFAFEHEKNFVWSQLWKEKQINAKVTSSSGSLTHMIRNYYQNNPKMQMTIDTFRQLYRSNDVLRWCLRSPFPLRPLNHALRTCNIQQLNFYAFLLNDVRCAIKRQKHKSPIHVYKGLKVSNEFLENLIENEGKLLCASGLFVCTKSRTAAWSLALSPSQRSDLCPILFSIACDRWTPFTEIPSEKKSNQIMFDIYTCFRIIHVSKGQVSIVKMKAADKQGRQLARELWNKDENKNINAFSPQQVPISTSPIKLPAIQKKVVTVTIAENDEIQAEKHLARGKVDLALAAYQRIKPASIRILNIIGRIYAEKKNDQDAALKYHSQALKLQEINGEDISETLTDLAVVHHNRKKFDLALSYHTRALKLRESIQPKNSLLVANSLRGIANAHWARREFSEALTAARKVLQIHQNLKPIDTSNVATSWATLANIYHESGDSTRALELGVRAVVLLESSEPANSSKLAAAYYNLAAFQLSKSELLEARYSFEKAFKIYSEIYPLSHPTRTTIANHIQNLTRLQRETAEKYLKDNHE